MDNLISRLSELRSQYSCFDESERDAYHTLSEAIEALQEQKTGKWVYNIHDILICDRCGYMTHEYGNYCPNCGALMEKG